MSETLVVLAQLVALQLGIAQGSGMDVGRLRAGHFAPQMRFLVCCLRSAGFFVGRKGVEEGEGRCGGGGGVCGVGGGACGVDDTDATQSSSLCELRQTSAQRARDALGDRARCDSVTLGLTHTCRSRMFAAFLSF